MVRFLLGMDGGGSSARARLVDRAGQRLGEGAAGPANIGNDMMGAIAAFEAAADVALSSGGLSRRDRMHVAAVIGAAGAGNTMLAGQLAAAPFGFRSLRVFTDAEIALEGAFAGGDGGIVIVGTGSQGYGRAGDRHFRVGGWGPSLSDGGSGAVIGRRAARRALEAHERLAPSSPMTEALFERMGGSTAALSAFGKAARPADWAGLAPVVFGYAYGGDAVAAAIIAMAVAEIEALVGRLIADGVGRVALMGGLAASFRPHLSRDVVQFLADPLGDALEGALGLAREDVGS
jgi:glucosamine kinase